MSDHSAVTTRTFRLDVEALARDGGFRPEQVRKVAKILSPTTRAIEEATSLHRLSELNRTGISPEERARIDEREEEMVKVVATNATNLEDLHLRFLEIRDHYFRKQKSHIYYTEWTDQAIAILKDPVRRPLTLEALKENEVHLEEMTGTSVRHAFQSLVDLYFESVPQDSIMPKDMLLWIHRGALSPALAKKSADMILKLLEATPDTDTIAEYAGKISSSYRAPFATLLETVARAELGRLSVIDQINKLSARPSEGRVEEWYYVSFDLREKLGRELYRYFLKTKEFDTAQALKSEIFGSNQVGDAKRLLADWDALYFEAYDEVHLETVTNDLTLDELKLLKAPYGSRTHERIQHRIAEREAELVEATTGLEELGRLYNTLYLYSNPPLAARVREKRRVLLEAEFALLTKKEEFLSFKRAVRQYENADWDDRVIEKLIPFYPKPEPLDDIVELPL